MAGAHLDADVAQAGVSKPSLECGVREPKVLVTKPGAHPLLIVFAQIEHQEPAAGAKDPDRLGHCRFRIRRMVQRLGEEHDVNRCVVQGQASEIPYSATPR